MKRVITFIVLSLFLIGFIAAAGMTASAIDDENDSENETNQMQERERARTLTSEQIQKITTARNRIKTSNGECPQNCACDGSTTKCQINEGREMTIKAGNSGNTIVQVKGINASTKVALYKSEDKIYGVFRNNQTREIILPDKVQEKIREHIRTRLENQTIELDEDRIYRINMEKRARLFFLFPVKEKVRIEMDSETGDITKIQNPWWGFLAKDETSE